MAVQPSHLRFLHSPTTWRTVLARVCQYICMYGLLYAGRSQRVDIDTTDSKAGKSATCRYGGEGGILTQSLRASCNLFSNMHEKPMNTRDFSDFYFRNSIKIFSCLVLIRALNRHQRHQGGDRAGWTLIRTLWVHTRRAPCFRPVEARYVLVFETIY